MKENSIIITVSVCLIAIFSSFMFVYSNTLQRSADDLVKIRNQQLTEKEARRNDCLAQDRLWTGYYCADKD